MRKGVNSIKGYCNQGFTIVELLVVIVVIGILAAITIISYAGISQKATVATMQSDLDNASKTLKMYYTLYSSYPTALNASNCPTAPTADNNYCLKFSGSNIVGYNGSMGAFNLVETNGTTYYKITNDSAPVAGSSLDYGLVLHLDASNSASYPSPFNGTTWTDLSGNSNKGTLYNGVGYDSGNGGGLVFDGTNDYVGVNNAPTLNMGLGDMTLSAWAKIPTGVTDNYGDLVGKNSWNGSLAFGIVNAGDQIRGYLSNTGVSDRIVTSAYFYASNIWHQYTLTFTRSGLMRLYVDGTIFSSVSISSYASMNFTNSSILMIGQYSGWAMQGTISKVRAYNRALTDIEVEALYNS
ncbi:MAG: LamG domain-containing protein [Candidatus Saccharimonadales bacterium]